MELLLISSSDPAETRWNWDIDVNDGMPEVVPEGAEEDQEAAVVTYLEKDTIPLMPERGVDWPGYLSKKLSLAEVDTQIRENLKTYLDTVVFAPAYSADKGQLNVNLIKVIINTGA